MRVENRANVIDLTVVDPEFPSDDSRGSSHRVLFGNQKDDSFKGILGNIVQTFGGEYLYRSIEEQTANLLYLTIKNHPFNDGNKRIGAYLFVWFLEKTKHRFKK